jgi:hypothetical protein
MFFYSFDFFFVAFMMVASLKVGGISEGVPIGTLQDPSSKNVLPSRLKGRNFMSVNFVNLFYMYPRIYALAHAKILDLFRSVLPPTLIMLELQGSGHQGFLNLSGPISSMMCLSL